MATGPDNGGNGPDREYDVCLSFAGEQRPYVAEVAEHLAGAGVRVFYDEAEQVNLSGKDLYVHLDYIYQRAARYCVLFASVHYASKVWPSHERASAQARALRENAEYILPVRFDDTEIPGLRATVGYLSASEMAPRALADAVVAKLGRRIRHKYLPPLPDRLFDDLQLSPDEEEIIDKRLRSPMTSLIRTTADERRLLFSAFAIGCPTALPANIHITLDLLRRDTGMAPREIVQLLKGLSSLGFEVELRQGHDDDEEEEEEEEELVVVEWHDRTVYDDIEDPDDGSILDSSCGAGVLNEIFSILVKDHCDECIQNAIEHLDLGFLASPLTEH